MTAIMWFAYWYRSAELTACLFPEIEGRVRDEGYDIDVCQMMPGAYCFGRVMSLDTREDGLLGLEQLYFFSILFLFSMFIFITALFLI